MKRLAPTVALVVALVALTACSRSHKRSTSDIEAHLEGAGVVMLWCQQPGAAKCAAASRALGVVPVRTDLVPARLLGPMLDEENDCLDGGVVAVLRVVAEALSIDPGNWHDNVGGSVDRASLDKTFVGGGCTNCCWDKSEPPVKVHAVDATDGRRYLVRVWEFDGS